MNSDLQKHVDSLRTRIKQLRSSIPPDEYERSSLMMRARLYTWLATTRSTLKQQNQADIIDVAAFWPLPQEPDLRPLLNKWAMEGELRLYLPVVVARGQALRFKLWTPDTDMRAAAYGIYEPEGDTFATQLDLVIVPTLGYTRNGHRLGYGGGYYDRTLALLQQQQPGFISLGLAWACGDLSGLDYTPQSHDMPLDTILTDKGWALQYQPRQLS